MQSRFALPTFTATFMALFLILGCLDADNESSAGGSPRGWFRLDSTLASSRLVDIYFPDPDTGYAVGDSILKTTNGGASWFRSLSGAELLTTVFFIDGRHGWTAGARGTVFRTSDGGDNWLSAESRTDGGFARGIFFTSPLKGFCAGDFGVVSRTTDGGVTWNSQAVSAESEVFWSLSFPASDTGYAVGNDGVIVRTVDGGASWATQVSGTLSDLYEVQFLTPSFGYAAGAGLGHGIVLKTTNAGETWKDVTGASAGSQGHTGMHFINRDVGWVVGDFGSIFRTTNGGADWTRQDTARGNNLRAVFFVSAKKGWAVEMYQGMLTTLNGGLP